MRIESVASWRASIERNPRQTIEPPSRIGSDAGDRAMGTLHALGRSKPTLAETLQIERTLGEGGMGVVHLATQTALARRVAVKRLQDSQKHEHGVTRLMQEAWATGGLEHPNIVPVYDISLDQDGFPAIVLKRIEGVHWGELVHDPRYLQEHTGSTDPEEFNLRTLMAVCNAVHFAHSRGVVHRDLKPENVMIGEFGEVYVLDWGLAVGVGDNQLLPRAEKQRDMAGTPAYMAPEMVGAEGSAPLSERTDVYLLGAILYEVITGKAPHLGTELEHVIASVITSKPSFPDNVPTELRQICRQAMHRDPQRRYSSAEELRVALDQYLRHRGSLRLAAEAQRSFDELASELYAGTIDDERRRRLYNLFGECRFGFRAALQGWAENPVALEGLNRSTAALVNFELAHGDPDAAARLLAELEAPPEDLAQRVAHARVARAQQTQQLEALSRELDPAAGSRVRSVITIGMAFIWTIVPLFGEHFERAQGGPSHATNVAMSAVFLVIVGALGWWGRHSMLKTAVNRGILATILFTMFAMIMLRAGAIQLDIEPRIVHSLNFFLWFSVTSILSFYVDLKLVVAAGAYLAAFLISSAYPAWTYKLMAAGNATLMVVCVWLWWPRWQQKRRAVEDVRRLMRQTARAVQNRERRGSDPPARASVAPHR